MSKSMDVRTKKCIKILFAVLSIFVVSVFYLRVGCPFRWLTGVSCPGCGMSRAVLALLHFDFSAAFHYHPLVFSLPLVFAAYVFRKHLPSRLLRCAAVLFICSMLSVYVFRLLSGSDVVCFEPSTGVLYKLFGSASAFF